MQRTMTHVLERIARIRRRLELERRLPRSSASRLLRLQAMLLEAQLRLAELTRQPEPRPVPVLVDRQRRSAYGMI